MVVPRTISRFRKELVEMDIEKAGFIMKGQLMPQKRMHALYMCLNQKDNALVIMDHALFGKVSSNDSKKFMEAITKMETPEFYTIGAPFSGKQNRKSYVKVPRTVPTMTKREKKAMQKQANNKYY